MASTSNKASNQGLVLKPPCVVQWNCHGLAGKVSELNKRFLTIEKPAALLLQEVGGVQRKIAGYNVYMTPTIVYKTRGRKRKTSTTPSTTPNAPVAKGQAAVFVDANLPQHQIDMSQYCNQHHEIVAVLLKIGVRELVVVSVYERPGYNIRSNAAAWIPHLKLTAGKAPVIVGGDFNAMHTMWGYSRDSHKGEEIAEAMTLNGFRLANDVDMPTRIGMHAKQNDTTPDLTWTTRNIELEWQITRDCVGSDHLPIILRLSRFSTGAKKRVHKRVKWDKFREALDGAPIEGSFTERLQAALKEATQDIKLREGDPTPDSYLLNLWASRLEALEKYKKEGKTPALRAKLNLATARARRYSNQLAKQQWQDHCDTFDGRSGLDKVWRTLQSMEGRKKSKTAAQNIALALRVSEDQVAADAGELFFPQPATPTPAETYNRVERVDGESASAPFTMGELISALRQCRTRSTPGPDGITYALLRNLPDKHSEELLTWINHIWYTGQVPEEWKTSWVIPIPKPGKLATTLANMRPISLTSNLCKLTERMALYRIQHILENNGTFHYTQTGFRRHLGTQDSLLMIYTDVLETPSKVDPRIVVAIDVKKAFDSVPHKSIINSAVTHGIQGAPLNFIKSFLEGRKFTVKVGNTEGPETPNGIGVPQGAVLSPTLFNLVMADLPPRLAQIQGLSFTIYADDVTIWTKGGAVGRQEEILQEALDTVIDFLDSVGMTVAPEKTQYIVVGNKRIQAQTETQNIRLTMKGKEIQRVESLRVLGLFLDQDGKPNTWMQRVTKTWKSTLHLIRRVATKKWGATEKVTRTLALALLASKVLYAYNYNKLTQTQAQKLEVLNREAMRVISGLPRFAKIEDLHIHSKLNTLKERADALKEAQLDRLKTTEAGRDILRYIGYATNKLPTLPARSLEESTIQLTTFAPLARNMGKDHKERRFQRAMEHIDFVREYDRELTNLYVYTDAALTGDGQGAIGWFMLNFQTAHNQAIQGERSTKEAELQAILAGAKNAATQHNKTQALYKHVWVFTDSREAHAECDNVGTYNNTVRQLRELGQQLTDEGRMLRIGWVPGHSGIYGNEEANNAARMALEAEPAHREQDQQEPSQEGENDVPPFDPDEFLSLGRMRRRKALADMIPQDPYGELPAEYNRSDRIILRRIRTNTALTPALRAKLDHTRRIRHPDYPGPVLTGDCTRCGTCKAATAEHLIWGCNSTARMRRNIISELPACLRPTTFTEWTRPEGTTPQKKLVLDSLLKFIREADLRHHF